MKPNAAILVPERYDLYEDVVVKLRFDPLTRAEQHAQLERVAAAERERWVHVFDGWSVFEALTPEQRKRIGYGDVSDVLDAVARLSRA